MLDSSLNFRTQAEIKYQAFNVIKSYCLTPDQVLNMFLTQNRQNQYHSAQFGLSAGWTTCRAMEDSLNGEVLYAYSFEEFQNQMRDLCKS